ncbi:transmembrane protein, putative [Medicago truncatula]|uniref:Transmembrane protein, putative n=1 Tax=Medicago truncatula TaxID=3880 RepID=A0A072V4X9_MEDTR|nr:transmembrane protein, putative [Medicago truncatula]
MAYAHRYRIVPAMDMSPFDKYPIGQYPWYITIHYTLYSVSYMYPTFTHGSSKYVILYIVLNIVHLHVLMVRSMSYIVPNNSDFVANVNTVIITFSV